MKKQSNLSRLLETAGSHKYLTYTSWVLSAISALIALVPFYYIWKMIKEVLEVAPNFDQAQNLTGNGWMAVLFAVIAVLVYIAGLMCSHLGAFRIATNLRIQTMEHIVKLPLGFAESFGSGKLRKIVNESSAATETYLAHQLPDRANAIATPCGLLVLLFVFDWRLGLLSLVPVVLGFLIMMAMTGKQMQEKMKEYQNALDDMSNEAVEYVRGIPVVKTFGQTIFSFKKFKDSIDRYKVWVIAYTRQLRTPMMFYTAAINGVFATLIAGGLLLTQDGVTSGFLLDLIFYIIITPVISVTLQECIETVRDLKANNAEQAYLKGLEKKIRAVEHRSILNEFGLAVFVVSASLVLKLGIATVALVGAVLLMQGSLSVLTFFMFLLVVSRLYDPLQGALQNLAAVISTRTNIARMNEILDHPIQQGSDRLSNQGYDIVFDHVGFAYNTGETVLKDVSFTAKQGEVTALVGPSGGGKTTVSRLAARFWDINRGKITVGGMDVSRIDPETLLSLYSIVFQDVTLFDNTILENIRIGNKDATDEQVIAAAKLANVDEFAEKLPDGWHTNIGENGCELSGGERQRISIARAFLKNAPIILLDEATASLDVENETLIQTALSRLIADKTVLVIAHRMRTVAGADKIVVLSDGTVAEEGSPKDLEEKNGVYAHMVKLQTESQNWKLA